MRLVGLNLQAAFSSSYGRVFRKWQKHYIELMNVLSHSVQNCNPNRLLIWRRQGDVDIEKQEESVMQCAWEMFPAQIVKMLRTKHL